MLPIVAVHGITSSPSTWGRLVLAFKAYGVPVHSVPLLGHGPRETRRGTGSRYLLEDFADDLVDRIDALGLDGCAITGHSLGALVTSLVVQRQPDRFSRVLLEDMPVPRREAGDPPPMRRFSDVLVMEAAALLGRDRFDPRMVWRVSGQLLGPRPQWWKALGRMTMPVLLVGGGRSSYLRQDRLREVAQTLPDARMVTVDGGHRSHITREKEFYDVAVPFLSNGRLENPVPQD